MRGQLADELAAVFAVEQRVVESDAAAHEHLLHAGQRSQFAQQLQVVGVVGAQLVARLGRQAALVRAGAAFQLLGASGRPEVRRRPAHVVDIALEVRIFAHCARFGQDRLVAARLHDAPLMEVERAEGAIAHAPAVARQRELHLGQRRHAARRVVARVPRAFVRQVVDGVELLGCQRLGRWVLHDEHAMRVFLDQRVRRKRVEVFQLQAEAARIGQLVGLHVRKRWQHDGLVHVLDRPRAVRRAGDERQVRHRQARCQRIGDGHDRTLAHAVRHHVGARVQQHRSLQRIGPVVVVRQPPQAGLDAAQDDGRVLERAADQVAVHHARMVGPQPHFPARRVGI